MADASSALLNIDGIMNFPKVPGYFSPKLGFLCQEVQTWPTEKPLPCCQEIMGGWEGFTVSLVSHSDAN